MPIPTAAHELVLTRLIKAPRHQLFRCWTEPALITRWFTPPPWKTIAAEIDVRPGGASLITLQGPDGTLMPNAGQYLEVVTDRRLAFTDAFVGDWVPSAKPFFACLLSFDDEAGQTRYTARACTGRPRTVRPTRRWVSTRAGALPLINWPPWRPRSSSPTGS